MTKICEVDLYGTRGQVIVMLLQALTDGPGTRQGTVQLILERGWFNVQDEDWPAYQSQQTRESRWKTLIAWGRKDAFDNGLLDDIGRDVWQISREGRRVVERLRSHFRDHPQLASRCYLWTSNFKTFMSPRRTPSEGDAPRPSTIYAGHSDLRQFRSTAPALAFREARGLIVEIELDGNLEPWLRSRIGYNGPVRNSSGGYDFSMLAAVARYRQAFLATL